MADGDGADGPKEPRRPKRKVALMLGYRGTDFNGLQINPGMKTIEGTVFDALVQVGCVSAENSINPNKVRGQPSLRCAIGGVPTRCYAGALVLTRAQVGLARTARTDAGVHAAINVLVIKLILDPPSLPEGVSLVDHINAALPDAIRLWSIVRVQGAFNPRKLCDARTYLYYLPTYALLPPPPGSALAAMLAGQGGDAPVRPADDAGDAFWRGVDGLTGNEAVMAAQRAWRIDPATLERMRGHARRFEGSHNFHNYSPAAKFGDRSSQRNIRSITVAEPTIAGGIEWVAIEIVGQSFMLNQIRKMVGLLALAVRTYTPSSLIPETFGPTKVHTPMAPSLGLLLDRPHFEQYNRKVAGNNSLLAAQTADEDTLREPLEYGPELVQRVDDFKRSVILERMWADEAATNTCVDLHRAASDPRSFGSWTDKFNANAGTDFKFCNSRGAVPRTDVKPAADEVEDDDARQMLAKGGRGLDELEG